MCCHRASCQFSPVAYLLIVSVLLASCEAPKQIAIDPELNSNSERWKASVKHPMFYASFRTLGKSSFGPYRTRAYEKLDSPKLTTRSHKAISFHLFRREETFSERRVYKFDVASDSDTAHVLLFLWFSSITSEPGFFSKKDSETLQSTKDASGEIYINRDSLPWNFRLGPYATTYLYKKNIYRNTEGYLHNNEDTIIIYPATEFTDSRRGFTAIGLKGLLLNNKNDKSLAALQLLDNNYIWIRKGLPADRQLAIAALFAAILGLKDL